MTRSSLLRRVLPASTLSGWSPSARTTRATLASMALAWVAACGDVVPRADLPEVASCVAACEGRTCGTDGCGGVCGTCGDGAACTDAGQCISISGPDGSNGPDGTCVGATCGCQPQCTAATCGAPEACGGTCPACSRDVSCADCPLVLTVVDSEVIAGAVRSVTVALDFAPKAGSPLPGLADLRFALSGGELVQVALGQSLIDADKGLSMDPETGKAYRKLPNGVIQLFVVSTRNATTIAPGRWLFLTFALPAPATPSSVTPLQVALIDREEILAPPPADAALWGSGLGTALIVWPDLVGVIHAP